MESSKHCEYHNLDLPSFSSPESQGHQQNCWHAYSSEKGEAKKDMWNPMMKLKIYTLIMNKELFPDSNVWLKYSSSHRSYTHAQFLINRGSYKGDC